MLLSLERGGRRKCPFMGGGNFSFCEGDYVRPQKPLVPMHRDFPSP